MCSCGCKQTPPELPQLPAMTFCRTCGKLYETETAAKECCE